MRPSQRSSRSRVLSVPLVAMLVLATIAGVIGGVGSAASSRAQDSSQKPDATVRVLDASPGSPSLDVLINGQPLVKNIAFGAPSSYASLKPDSYKVQVVPTGQSADNALAEKDFDASSGDAYIVSIVNPLKDVSINVDKVNLDAIDAGKARVRVVNDSPDAGKIDATVTGGDNWFSGIDQGDASDYKDVDAGTYSLDIRSSDGQTLTTAAGLTLQDGEVYDIFAIGQISDKSFALVPLATSVSEPCVSVLGLTGTATDACVRVIHAAPGTAAVDVYVNGSASTKGLAFAASTDYLVVPAGDSTKIQVTAAGASPDDAAASDTTGLDAGQAYEFVITGAPNDVKLTEARLDLTPLPSGQSRVRLINASPDAGSVDLTVKNGDKVFDNVDFRDVSDYASLDAANVTFDALKHGASDVYVENAVDLKAATTYDIVLLGQSKDQSLAFLVVTSPASSRVGAVATPASEGTPVAAPTVSAVATQSSTVQPMTTVQTAPAATP